MGTSSRPWNLGGGYALLAAVGAGAGVLVRTWIGCRREATDRADVAQRGPARDATPREPPGIGGTPGLVLAAALALAACWPFIIAALATGWACGEFEDECQRRANLQFVFASAGLASALALFVAVFRGWRRLAALALVAGASAWGARVFVLAVVGIHG